MSRSGLLDPAFVKKLEALRIEARRAFPGVTKGERSSTRKGSSIEFADFRDYTPGDDLRHLDWNIFARLGRPMLRLYVEEEDVRVDVLVDNSASMDFGEPLTKLEVAKRVAAALGYLAIAGLDRVGAVAFAERLGPRLRAARGRGQLLSLLRYLERLEPSKDSSTRLATALERYSLESHKPGILFVISDFLDDSEYIAALKRMAVRRFDVNLIQVLTPFEIDPDEGGDLVLIDRERDEGVEVTLNAAALKFYRKALEEHEAALAALGPAAGVTYTRVRTDESFEDFLLRQLRARGLVGS